MNVIVNNQVKSVLYKYSYYLINSDFTSIERAYAKVDYIVDTFTNRLSNYTNGGSLCPYWKFSGSGRGYKMIRVPDKWTKTTVWCIAFEDIDENTRIVRGIELESVLACTDEKRYPPYQMKLPLDEHRMTRIIRQVIREMLYA